MNNFGIRLKKILEQKNITQRDLAEMAETTGATVSRYINDNRTPNAELIVKIASALNITADYLLGLTDNPAPLPQPQLSPEEMESFREWQKINNLSPYKQKIARKTIEILSEEEAATAQNS